MCSLALRKVAVLEGGEPEDSAVKQDLQGWMGEIEGEVFGENVPPCEGDRVFAGLIIRREVQDRVVDRNCRTLDPGASRRTTVLVMVESRTSCERAQKGDSGDALRLGHTCGGIAQPLKRNRTQSWTHRNE